jgi:hypothetical protein
LPSIEPSTRSRPTPGVKATSTKVRLPTMSAEMSIGVSVAVPPVVSPP